MQRLKLAPTQARALAQARALGWVTDATHHVVINETGVEVADGDLRYPSIADGHVEFPATCDGVTDWLGWIDAVNIGTAAGNFRIYLSSTIACTGDLGIFPEFTLAPGQYSTWTVSSTGGAPCPADFYICLMRYTP